MFHQSRLPMLISILMPITSVIAFMVPHASFTQRETLRDMSVDPSDIGSSMDQILEHPALEALFSTLYTATMKLEPAHGHVQSLFGPVDPYLLKMQSIVPAPNAGDALGTPAFDEASIPEKLKGAFEYARRGEFVDPTHVLRIDGDAPPGFNPPETFFPKLQAPPQTQDYQLGILNAEVGNLRALQKVPIAAFITVLVDFFLVTPGMEVFKEEIEENSEEITRESAIAGTARVAVLAIVAGLTLAMSG